MGRGRREIHCHFGERPKYRCRDRRNREVEPEAGEDNSLGEEETRAISLRALWRTLANPVPTRNRTARSMDPRGPKFRLVTSDLFGPMPLDFVVRGDLHRCPYLPGRAAHEQFFRADHFDGELYHDFMDSGFRRSGVIFYRPICHGCYECRPLRVLAGRFNPTKSQRRVWRKNEDLELRVGRPALTAEKYRMYSAYLATQHESGPEHSWDDMRHFLYTSPLFTLELEYRLRDRLVAVSIVDVCTRSLSSVYVYYDPDFAVRSLGTYSALKEIAICRERAIAYYYLGYYVAGCPSMNYKARFEPHEILSPQGQWRATRPTKARSAKTGREHGIDEAGLNNYIRTTEETTRSHD